ncbi:MAG: hypothetical protein ACJ735_05680 [Actinomycetes bacterium]
MGTSTLAQHGRARPVGAHDDSPAMLLLRVVAVVGLSVDVWVHATLESQYAGLGGALTQGRLFGAEAVAAGVVALWLLLTGGRAAWLATMLVAASALGAVLLYRYVNVGKLGPLPNMYEPVWYFRKSLSAYAEAVALLAAMLWLVLQVKRARRR